MIQSKEKLKAVCDKLMEVNPSQIIIDLVQDDIEEAIYDDNATPDLAGSLSYRCSLLLTVYNPEMKEDIWYLTELEKALDDWQSDLEFANKALDIDPNK